MGYHSRLHAPDKKELAIDSSSLLRYNSRQKGRCNVSQNVNTISIVVDYTNHCIRSVVGLSEGTELQLREYDENLGWIVGWYTVRNDAPVFTGSKIECASCGGSGKWSEESGGGLCSFCDGTGFDKG